MTTTIKNGIEVEDSRLGRVPYHDPRSLDYDVTDKLYGVATERLRTRTYRVGRHLDQGREGACVGFAYTHELIATPIRVFGWQKLDDAFARDEVYHPAQHDDPWAGCFLGQSCPIEPGPKADGTGMLPGIKVLQRMGFISEYRWAFSEPDLASAVAWVGGAIIGVPWFEGMYNTDSNGYINPTGRLMGYHAIFVHRFVAQTKTRKNDWYEVWNSWGKDKFGKNGTAKVSRDSMAYLLDGQFSSEACIPLKRVRRPRPDEQAA